MARALNKVYLFISDDLGRYYSASQAADGTYVLDTTVANPSLAQPLRNNPSNISESYLEFGTNSTYFSLARSINYPLEFIKDGAFILNSLFSNGKGVNQKAYLTVVEWNGVDKYILSYRGRFDFFKKEFFPEENRFVCPCVDDTAWGILSEKDDVTYSVDCNASNPRAIKVLVDGITLVNKYTYQTVNSQVTVSTVGVYQTAPFVLVNEDGDSSGIIAKNQSSGAYATIDESVSAVACGFETSKPIQNVVLEGSLSFQAFDNRPQSSTGGVRIYFRTSEGQQFDIFNFQVSGSLQKATTYAKNFSFTFNLAANEKVSLIYQLAGNVVNQLTIIPQVKNISISTRTKSESVITYALRPLDLLKEFVRQATNGRYTINSNHFTENNKDVLTCGQALRGLPNAKIYSSFKDFFTSFNATSYLALRNINETLWIEKAVNVYRHDELPLPPSDILIDLGQAISCSFIVAEEMYANEIEVGGPVVDYRHPSGRLDFNSTNKFTAQVTNTKNKLSLVSKYRLSCYDAQFMILNYQNGSTQDNNGDNEVYMLSITDEIGSGTDEVETFINPTIDNATLVPVIKSPLNNDLITYDKPNVRGIAKPLDTVNIYVDNVFDGTTTADANGDWSYDINTALSPLLPPTQSGVHVIQATFTDLLGPTESVSVLIDTSITTPTQINYPANGDNLYNNKPLIKGVAQRGTNINITLDGVLIGSVTADNSCKWQFKMPVIPNGSRAIGANAEEVTVDVNSSTEFPLITFFGSELDGFPVINNLPLVEGVGIPGTVVKLYLDYITYSVLGTTTIDSNGNGLYQIVPISYPDPCTSLPVVMAPLKNGVNIISTSLTNNVVPIGITGFKLDRPAYSQILGVPDNTVFNTKYSPKRMMQAHYPKIASMQVPLTFQKADKNGNLSTTLNGVTVKENSNVSLSELGTPQFLLEYVKVKTNVNSTFNQLLYDFNNGGVIKFSYRGKDIYCYPIGSMRINNIEDNVQEWKLLMANLTTRNTILGLYKEGTFITLNRGQMFHSDYNSLHGVEYGFTQEQKYDNMTIYQDWFMNRNKQWTNKPKYIQKFQRTETDVRDQITVNGLVSPILRIYDCSQAVEGDLNIGVVATINYEPVDPAPITGPTIVYEASIDMSTLEDRKQYFGVVFVGETPIMIFERWEVRNKWNGTILVEASNSQNIPGFFYSTGIKTILRLEGLVQKLQPNVMSIVSKDDNGNTRSLYNLMAKKVSLRFGTAFGLPDFLYLKMASAIILDNFKVEGVDYTIAEDEKIEPAEQADGHPMYFYNIGMNLKENERGKTFEGVPGVSNNSVVLIIDGEAMGLPAGNLVNIELENE